MLMEECAVHVSLIVKYARMLLVAVNATVKKFSVPYTINVF